MPAADTWRVSFCQLARSPPTPGPLRGRPEARARTQRRLSGRSAACGRACSAARRRMRPARRSAVNRMLPSDSGVALPSRSCSVSSWPVRYAAPLTLAPRPRLSGDLRPLEWRVPEPPFCTSLDHSAFRKRLVQNGRSGARASDRLLSAGAGPRPRQGPIAPTRNSAQLGKGQARTQSMEGPQAATPLLLAHAPERQGYPSYCVPKRHQDEKAH